MGKRIAVHCNTKDEWESVRKKADNSGVGTWGSQHEIDRARGDNICLYPEGHGGWDFLSVAKRDGCKIISAAEYLNEGGKDVSEFKVGDMVECMDAERSSYLEKGEIYTIERLFIDCENMFLEGLKSGYDNKRFKLVHVITDKTQTTKENNMELNSSIRTVLVEENKAEFAFVEKFQATFGKEIAENFTGAMILRANMTLYVAEIKRLDDIETKRLKEEAKKK